MTTPSDPGASEIDLTKPGGGTSAAGTAGTPDDAPFDPYRFGKPDFPVPPEFAPPGYVPDPVPAPSPYPGAPYQGGPAPYVPPSAPYPYGAPPYGPPSQYPPSSQYPQPQSPYGAMPPGYGYGPPPQTGSNGKAVTALVAGIASIVLCWLSFFDIVPVVLAIVFGILGLSEARKRNGSGKGMAVAGLVCGAVGAIIAIVLSVLIVQAYSDCGGTSSRHDSGFNQCVQDKF